MADEEPVLKRVKRWIRRRRRRRRRERKKKEKKEKKLEAQKTAYKKLVDAYILTFCCHQGSQ